MDCEQIYVLLSAKLDGALTASEEEQLNAHLENCADCRRLYEAMFEIEKQTKALAQPAPEGLKRGVLYRIRQESGKGAKKRRFFGAGTGLGAIAAALVLLLGTGVIHLPKHAVQTDRAAAVTKNAYSEEYVDLPVDSPSEALPDNWFLDSKTLNNGLSEGSKGALGNDISLVPDRTATEPGETKTADYALPGLNIDAANSLCEKICSKTGAPVLLYTDFPEASLLTLLQDEAPELFRRLTAKTDGAADPAGQPTVCETDYETVLALQEWLLVNLPPAQTAAVTKNRLQVQLEALDPDSDALYRVITWAPAAKPVDWPETWPEGWADRLRSGESWALFYPTEDFIPAEDGPAYLVFGASAG